MIDGYISFRYGHARNVNAWNIDITGQWAPGVRNDPERNFSALESDTKWMMGVNEDARAGRKTLSMRVFS